MQNSNNPNNPPHSMFSQAYGRPQDYAAQRYPVSNVNYAPPGQHQFHQQNAYPQQHYEDDESRNYRYPSAQIKPDVSYAPQMVHFEVEAAPHGSDDFRTIQKKLKKREKKLKEWKVTCYKWASFIFALLAGFSTIMYFFMMLTGSVEDMSVSSLFIAFIFTGAECYMFYTAYRSVADYNLKDAKNAVQYFKIFMITYGIVSLILAYKTSDSNRTTGKAYDPDEPESTDRDARILAIIVNEIIYGLFIYQAIKNRKNLYKLYMYKSQISTDHLEY